MNDSPKKADNDFFLRFLVNKRYRLYRHLILILFLAAVVFNRKGIAVEPVNSYMKIALLVMLLLLSYLNMYQLVPKLLFNNKYAGYGLSVLGLIGFSLLVFVVGRYLLKPYFRPSYTKGIDEFNLFGFIFIFCVLIAASAAVKLFQRWIRDSKRINELERATMQSE